MKAVTERFLKYVAIDTQSDPNADTVPSTEKQRNLANILVEELKEMGAENVQLEEHCYVYATIPATTDKPCKTIGFIAHMDTSDAVSGKDVKARIVKDYDGKTIVLNKELGYELNPEEFPSVQNYVNKDLIVTDGTTLLGADDKAGIAEIMTAAEYLLTHKEIPHGTIQIAFTPDEEVGRGVDFFDVEGFGADFAYTVDGGELGELEYENFNAANFTLTIRGKSAHPGSAKGAMINALLVGMEFQNMLPTFENPAFTEGYEGFYHLCDMNGNCDEVVMEYIIRDHDNKKFEEKVAYFKDLVAFMNRKYNYNMITIEESVGYKNMKCMIEPHMHLIENAKKAMEMEGVEPKIVPIRGGTDGARLSFMGLPCPNLCTGGHNFHGRYEYICVQSMETCVNIIVNLAKIYGEER